MSALGRETFVPDARLAGAPSGSGGPYVPPRRIIKGARTGLSYPASLFVDLKNQELWVSNLGNASATVYPLNASGDVVPLRKIRSAPEGKVSLKFGKTQAVTYDTKREEILVPN